MSMSLPHVISGHASLQSESTRQLQQQEDNQTNQNTTAKQQPLTSPSTHVSLSEESRHLLREEQKKADNNKIESNTSDPTQQLSKKEKQEIEHLKQRDQEVKNHEQAHATIGGQYAGAPRFTYDKGPDNKRYAVDGEVSIDLTEIANNPQATIDKMNKVYQAALAPAQPSNQDRSVALEAKQSITEAKLELIKERIKTDQS